MTAARFATWDNAIFATQPIQFAGSRFIHGKIHAVDKILFLGNGDIDSVFLGAHTQIAVLKQMHYSPFFQGDFQADNNEEAPYLISAD
ncbi:MAG: hypothetical protein CVT68_12575 [Actinobacteria bacterium HGW-Actinobacteria-8]|nr:MAG: hypothetical protein CVT68_12575 [Actinobacteria bacterium HGW-Actinobacteria-8]